MFSSLFANLLVGLIVGMAPPATTTPTVQEKVPTISFKSSWLLLADVKPGVCRLFHAPFIMLDLKDGDERMTQDSQGILTSTSSGNGHKFISRGEIRMKGSEMPFTVSVRYEFRDDNHHHFLIDDKFEVPNEIGQCALATPDGKAVLMLSWETKSRIPTPQPKTQPSDAYYYLDVVSVCLGPCPHRGPYVLDVPAGRVEDFKDWFHCGPLQSKASKGNANSFYGPNRKDREHSRLKEEDLEYEGTLKYSILSDGFPLRIDAKFTLTSLKEKLKVLEISGEVQFRDSGDYAIIRSKTGDHLLLLRLSPAPIRQAD